MDYVQATIPNGVLGILVWKHSDLRLKKSNVAIYSQPFSPTLGYQMSIELRAYKTSTVTTQIVPISALVIKPQF